MGGIIDFNTSCPWELYLFALFHLAGAAIMYFFDSCRLLYSTPCTDSELVFQQCVAVSFLYVGALFAVLTYHNKQSADKITTLSNMALNGSVALLVSVVFAGNASFGGIERSWMHMGDMLSSIILVAVLIIRVSKSDAGWAQKNPINEGMGINCKTLLLIFLAMVMIKFVVYCDFMDPLVMLTDGSEMTGFSFWMWKFTAVLILETFLAILHAVLFDDDAGQELVVFTMMILLIITGISIQPVQKYMSSWMGMNDSIGLWVWVGVFVAISILAIAGGRRGGSHRSGYQAV
jgi:hypothetical protein